MASKRLIVITVPVKNGEIQKRPALLRSANQNFLLQPRVPIPRALTTPNIKPIIPPVRLPPQSNANSHPVKRHFDAMAVNTSATGGGYKRSSFSSNRDDEMNMFIDQASYGGDSADDLMDDVHLPRKRQRLTHLTPEEKLSRRKLKNRIAAHMARERRKNFMVELEQRYKRLRYENDGLKSRNEQFRHEIDRLGEENKEMKHQIELLRQETQAARASGETAEIEKCELANHNVVAATVECSTVESAEFVHASQQQERVVQSSRGAAATPHTKANATQALIRTLTCLLTTLMSASSSSCSTASSPSTTATGAPKSPAMQRDWQEIVNAFNVTASKGQVSASTLSQLAKLLSGLSAQMRTTPP